MHRLSITVRDSPQASRAYTAAGAVRASVMNRSASAVKRSGHAWTRLLATPAISRESEMGPRDVRASASPLDLGCETAKSQPTKMPGGSHEDNSDAAPAGRMHLLRDTALFC
jgi:hypothetical protein